LQKDADFESIAEQIPNVAREADSAGILALVELVAAAAVTCEDKEVFLTKIMDLEEESRGELQGILEDVLGRLTGFDDEGEEEDDDDSVEFEGENGESMTSPRNLFASHDDGELAKERDELRTALNDCRRQLAAAHTEAKLRDEDNESEQKKLRGMVDDLRSRLTKAEEDLTNEEQGAMKINRELKECMTKNRDLEEKNASLADELDVEKSKASKLPKLEASLAAYRKKLEGMGAMDQDVTSLQVQTEGYLQKIIALENENKKLPALQKSLEEAQNQAKKLEARYNEVDESLKAKDAELAAAKSASAAAENRK
jgi:protein HOOK3